MVGRRRNDDADCLDLGDFDPEHKKLVLSLARRLSRGFGRNGAWNKNDLIQAGLVGVLIWMREPDKSLYWRVKREMFGVVMTSMAVSGKPVREGRRVSRTPLSLGDLEDGGENFEAPESPEHDDRPERELEGLLGRLPEDRRKSICEYHGVLGCPKLSLDYVFGSRQHKGMRNKAYKAICTLKRVLAREEAERRGSEGDECL